MKLIQIKIVEADEKTEDSFEKSLVRRYLIEKTEELVSNELNNENIDKKA